MIKIRTFSETLLADKDEIIGLIKVTPHQRRKPSHFNNVTQIFNSRLQN
jgi:hypothetical protein